MATPNTFFLNEVFNKLLLSFDSFLHTIKLNLHFIDDRFLILNNVLDSSIGTGRVNSSIRSGCLGIATETEEIIGIIKALLIGTTIKGRE